MIECGNRDGDLQVTSMSHSVTVVAAGCEESGTDHKLPSLAH